MAKLDGGSSSTISRVFVAWMVFLCCVLDEVNLKPLPGFIEAFLPRVFVDAGYAVGFLETTQKPGLLNLRILN